MRPDDRNDSTVGRRIAAGLAALAMAAMLTSPARAGSWASYGENAQHTALAAGPSQIPQTIRWSTPVNLAPQYAGGGDLYTHYGSPVITAHNTVLVPVKTQAQGSFEVMAIAGSSGNVLWTLSTDYVLPSHNWIPPMGITLTGADLSVVVPGAGGSVWVRSARLSQGGARPRAFPGAEQLQPEPGGIQRGDPDLHAADRGRQRQHLLRL